MFVCSGAHDDGVRGKRDEEGVRYQSDVKNEDKDCDGVAGEV